MPVGLMYTDLEIRFGIGIRVINEIALRAPRSRNARLRVGLGKRQLLLLLQQSFFVSLQPGPMGAPGASEVLLFVRHSTP
jgi:hypothetical protein